MPMWMGAQEQLMCGQKLYHKQKYHKILTHNEVGFQYNYGQYNGNISVNTSGSGGDGIIRVDSSEIDGIDTTVFYNGTKYFYIIYYFEDEAGAEYLRVNLNINTTDENIYPDTLISAIFYRTKQIFFKQITTTPEAVTSFFKSIQ